jgi:hypothetical protein
MIRSVADCCGLLAIGFVVASFGHLASAAEIPVNIGVGPAAFYVPEHLEEDDPKPFYGFRLHIKAIIDKKLIEKNKGKIPDQYRKAVEKVDEVRVGYLLIPETVMLGTRTKEAGPEFFGATWRPIGLGVPLKMGPAMLSLDTGLLITYAFINTGSYKIPDQSNKDIEKNPRTEITFRDQTTHFLRPGMDLKLELEVKFSDSLLTSLGWSSAYYIPQKIGGGIGTVGADQLEKSLWRIHQAFVMLHYRLPVKAKI